MSLAPSTWMSFIRLFAPATEVPVTSGAVCSSSVKSLLRSGKLRIALSLTVCDAPMRDARQQGALRLHPTSASRAVSGPSTSRSESAVRGQRDFVSRVLEPRGVRFDAIRPAWREMLGGKLPSRIGAKIEPRARRAIHDHDLRARRHDRIAGSRVGDANRSQRR